MNRLLISFFAVILSLILPTANSTNNTTTPSPFMTDIPKFSNPSLTNLNVSDISTDFNSWMKRYNKTYDGYIKSKMAAIRDFMRNRMNIKEHNMRSNETYKRKLQKHSDLTFDEKKIYRMGANVDMISFHHAKFLVNDTKLLKNESSPVHVNYTRFFPPVKDQGYCGACWAFSSVSLLEYMSRLQGENATYSEQSLIDCDFTDGGCGWPATGLEYVRDYGVSDGLKYLFTGKQNEVCLKDLYPPVLRINDVCSYRLNGSEAMLKKLVQKSPVIVTLATTDGFTSYSSGIFYDSTCPTDQIDHALTIVGYGSEGIGKDYWILRNSWGADWGVNGYGLFARNRNNHCGIASFAMIVC